MGFTVVSIRTACPTELVYDHARRARDSSARVDAARAFERARARERRSSGDTPPRGRVERVSRDTAR